MTRDEAIELLELMKRQQHSESGVPPLDAEMLAKAYVRVMSRRQRTKDRDNGGEGPGGGGPQRPL